jgi:DNA-binding NarL/FixJ family response regulator
VAIPTQGYRSAEADAVGRPRLGEQVGREPPHRLIVATSRPAVYTFFSAIAEEMNAAPLRVDATTDAATAEAVADASAAIVDIGLDPVGAIDFCVALQNRRPGLPVTAVVCCPHSVTHWTLRRLVAVGVVSIIDLETTAAAASRALRSAARGELVVELRLGARRLVSMRDIFAGSELGGESQHMLELVAQGLSDVEIGGRLHLSPHTVKKRIEQLRNTVGARNRIELAAWAGRQGLYTPDRAPSVTA